ncbi:hypothetical protein N665_0495s0018 [Sinapis alba]|nr:hypothetical protein N665_0495s0018 [Sinapis alba]
MPAARSLHCYYLKLLKHVPFCFEILNVYSSKQIRAGHLSGDCHFKRELLRGFIKLRGHEQECIKRRVLKSLCGNPYCSEVAAKDAMEAVWDTCYNDTKPFDRAP